MKKKDRNWRTPEHQARYDAEAAKYNELHKHDTDNWILSYFKDQMRRAKPKIHDKP